MNCQNDPPKCPGFFMPELAEMNIEISAPYLQCLMINEGYFNQHVEAFPPDITVVEIENYSRRG